MDITLSQYLQALKPAERRAVAKEVGTSPAYLRHLAKGRKQTSLGLADALVAASGGLLDLEVLPLTDRARHQLRARVAAGVRERIARAEAGTTD
jgi:hypothetical protein